MDKHVLAFSGLGRQSIRHGRGTLGTGMQTGGGA